MAPASAQGARTVPLDDPLYHHVERLQRRGMLLELNPTALPYTHAALDAALSRVEPQGRSALERRWLADIRARVVSPPSAETVVATLETGAGAALTNNERLDVVRWTDAEDAVLQAGGANVYPNAVVHAALTRGPLVAQLGARFDVFYEDDPDGLDLVNTSVYLRNQEAYAGVVGTWGEAVLGTVGRTWGLASGEGLFVSNNPRPYDALSLRLGSERLAVRSIVAELDAATPDGRFTGRVGDTSRETALRRYLYAHRIDWRPRPWIVISAVESMLTSGAGASPSLAAVVPTAVLSFLNDGPPKNNENNGIVGGILWLQRGAVTVHGQLAFDDFDLFNRVEPASAALTGSLVVAGVAERVDAGLDATVVTARAYNTPLPEQGYVYALRGLGTQFSDFIHLRVGADVYLDDEVAGLSLRPEVQVLWQGEGDIRDPFPSNDPPMILIGEPERTVRVGTRVRWTPTPTLWARADLGVNHTTSDGHVLGVSRTRFVGLVEAGARFRFSTRVDP